MASLNMAFGMATVKGRTFVTKATKGGGGGEEEKGLLDFILGALTKEDQFYETDPVLKKTEEKSQTVGDKKSTTSVSVPNKKKFPGFGGLFAKN